VRREMHKACTQAAKNKKMVIAVLLRASEVSCRRIGSMDEVPNAARQRGGASVRRCVNLGECPGRRRGRGRG